jgi:hypothetical protein
MSCQGGIIGRWGRGGAEVIGSSNACQIGLISIPKSRLSLCGVFLISIFFLIRIYT